MRVVVRQAGSVEAGAVVPAGEIRLGDGAQALLAEARKTSFIRVTAGFVLAAVMGIPLGILMGSFKVFEGALH